MGKVSVRTFAPSGFWFSLTEPSYAGNPVLSLHWLRICDGCFLWLNDCKLCVNRKLIFILIS
jgi:hypothetical protein